MRALTVAQLIEKLQTYPPTAMVEFEITEECKIGDRSPVLETSQTFYNRLDNQWVVLSSGRI